MSKIALPCLEQTQRLVVEQFLAQKVASDLLVILLSMGMEDEKKEERIELRIDKMERDNFNNILSSKSNEHCI